MIFTWAIEVISYLNTALLWYFSNGISCYESISFWNFQQDSKRFEGIDTDFKELANDAKKTPNVVEATNKMGFTVN